MKRRIMLCAAVALLVAACGDSDDGSATTAVPTTATTTTTTTQPTTTTTSPAAATTTEAPTTTITEPPTTTTTLAGEPFDLGFPREGDVLSVVGVAFDDLLNVREGPGNTPIVGVLDPGEGGVFASGRARLLPTTIWWEIDGIGWANASFLAYVGQTDDATAELVAGLGEYPTADTMAELGATVAGFFASDDPPSDVVMVVAPTVGDLGQVTFDVIGLGDDALRGFRLLVLAEPVADGFSLTSVERTSLCGRGLSNGLCV